jgi:hypothetical protein
VFSAPSSTAVKHGQLTGTRRGDLTASTCCAYVECGELSDKTISRTKSFWKRQILPQCFLKLSFHRFRWLGHTKKMDDGRIPKDLLYGKLQIGKRSWGMPYFGTEMCASGIFKTQTLIWLHGNRITIDRITWRGKIRNGLVVTEKMIANRSDTKHLRRHIRQ